MANISPGKFSDIPPSIINTRPALQPPAGVKSNFVNPEGRGHICNAVVTVLFCLTVCLFANRIYTKLFIVRKTGWDDLTCTIAFVGSLGMYIATLWSTIRAPVGKHQWDVRKIDTISGNFVTTSAILIFLSPITLLFAKLTFFFLYLQVFWILKWLRVSVYLGATLNCITYGTVSVAQVVLLTPKHGDRWIEQNLFKGCQKAQVLSIYSAAIGLGFDVILLVMPIAAVLELQLPKQRKMGVLFIFSIGIFACVGSLLSVYYRVILQRSHDITWNIMLVRLTSLSEILIGISCACMPAFSRMLHHHRPALEKFRSLLSSLLRFTKSTDVTVRSECPHHKDASLRPVVETIQGPYSHLEADLPSPPGATFQPDYQLGQAHNVHPFVGKGSKKEASDDDDIHLTHD